MRSSRLAHVQHTGVARSEQVWLLTLGSAPLRSCGATVRGKDQQTWPLSRDAIPVCMPWGIAPSLSEAPKRRCRGGTEAFVGCSWSDAVRCGPRGWQNTACWRSAERPSLAYDASVCSFTGLYSNRQSAGPASFISRLVHTRFGRPE